MFSLYLIIFGNMLPLIGRLFFGWDTSYFFFLYWIEIVFMFIFALLKMRRAEGVPDPAKYHISNKTKQEKISDFLSMGSGFLFAIGLFLFMLTFVVNSKYSTGEFIPLPTFNIKEYLIFLGVFFLGHVVEYWNYIREQKYKVVSVEEAQGWVFGHIMLLFMIVIIGPFFAGSHFRTSIIPLIIFALAKSAGDIVPLFVPMKIGSESSSSRVKVTILGRRIR